MSFYKSLDEIFEAARQQASEGKGKERHAIPLQPFEEQQACEVTRRLKGSSIAGPLFQAVKKIYESQRLANEAAIAELLGAINYIAVGIIVLKEKTPQEAPREKEPASWTFGRLSE